jgi:hypothetical protein
MVMDKNTPPTTEWSASFHALAEPEGGAWDAEMMRFPMLDDRSPQTTARSIRRIAFWAVAGAAIPLMVLDLLLWRLGHAAFFLGAAVGQPIAHRIDDLAGRLGFYPEFGPHAAMVYLRLFSWLLEPPRWMAELREAACD